MRIGRFDVAPRRVFSLAAGLVDLGVSARWSSPGPRRHRQARRWAMRTARRLRIDLAVSGTEHIRPDTSYLVLPLHESLVDPIGLLHLPLDLRFVARDELAEWRWLGRYLARADHFVIGTRQPWRGWRRVVSAAPDMAAAGESLVVFGQGSVLGIETTFLPGVTWLAGRLGWPVLPVATAGGHRVWEWPFSPRLRFGQPMAIDVLAARPAADLDLVSLQAEVKAVALAAGAPVRHFDPDRDGWWDGYRYGIDPAYPELFDRHAARSG